jgi:hypothetical protein
MPDELSGVSQIAIDRSRREFPRREPQQQGSKRQPHRPPQPQTSQLSAASDEDAPVVGSRLNVRA